MPRAAPRHRGVPRLAPVHVAQQQVAEAYGQGRGGRPWRRRREEALRRDDYLCRPCREADRIEPATQVDHIVPCAEGGTDELSNLQGICDACHDAKTRAEAARGAARARGPRRDSGARRGT